MRLRVLPAARPEPAPSRVSRAWSTPNAERSWCGTCRPGLRGQRIGHTGRRAARTARTTAPPGSEPRSNGGVRRSGTEEISEPRWSLANSDTDPREFRAWSAPVRPDPPLNPTTSDTDSDHIPESDGRRAGRRRRERRYEPPDTQSTRGGNGNGAAPRLLRLPGNRWMAQRQNAARRRAYPGGKLRPRTRAPKGETAVKANANAPKTRASEERRFEQARQAAGRCGGGGGGGESADLVAETLRDAAECAGPWLGRAVVALHLEGKTALAERISRAARC